MNFDIEVIKIYCIRKYGQNVVNILNRTLSEQTIFDEELFEKYNKSIILSLPVGEYQERWKHYFHLHCKKGINIDIARNIKIDILNEAAL